MPENDMHANLAHPSLLTQMLKDITDALLARDILQGQSSLELVRYVIHDFSRWSKSSNRFACS